MIYNTTIIRSSLVTDLRYNNLKDTAVLDPPLWPIWNTTILDPPLRLICNTTILDPPWDWFKKQISWIHPCGCCTHCCTSSGTKMYSIGMIWPNSDRDRTNLSLEENLALWKKPNKITRNENIYKCFAGNNFITTNVHNP